MFTGQVKPIYTQLYAEGNIVEFKKVIKKMILISTGFSIIAAVVLMFGSNILLKMYGDFYLNFVLSFNIMLVASIFFALQSQYGSIFQAIGKIWTCFYLNIVWSVIFLVSFILLSKTGVIGYTITYLISYLIYTVISIIVFYKTINNIKTDKEKKQGDKNETIS